MNLRGPNVVESVPKEMPQNLIHFGKYLRPQSSDLLVDLKQLEIKWTRLQFEMKKSNILEDTEEWQSDLSKLKRIAVLDIAFDKSDNSTACAGIMILEFDHEHTRLKLVYANLVDTILSEPYISGLLAFREGDVYEHMIKSIPVSLAPQCFIFDGNGILHKREFGLAAHLGVKLNCVSFGMSKNMHFIENRFAFKNASELKNYYHPFLRKANDYASLTTLDDHKVLGYAYLCGSRTTNPMFVSQGNKISGNTCLNVVRMCNEYLKNMNMDSRESIVGFIDKMTNSYFNDRNNFEKFFHQFYRELF